MKKALQQWVVPSLRQKGFKGSFPHFRRFLVNEIHVITFQFSKWGGEFTINIGKCPPDGITLKWTDGTTKHIPPQRVNCYQAPGNGKFERLGGLVEGRDTWFRYDNKPDDNPSLKIVKGTHKELAKKIIPYLDKAYQWWESEKL